MPAYPYRKNRRDRLADSRIERWQPPSSTCRDLVGGAVLGLACVGLAWVIVTAAGAAATRVRRPGAGDHHAVAVAEPGGRRVTAVERARQALAHIEAAWEDDDVPIPADFQAVHNLLAEHDSGVWLDTRDVDALLWNGRGVFMDCDPDLGWTIWRHAAAMFGAPTRIGAGMTARDAVRAAREADRG